MADRVQRLQSRLVQHQLERRECCDGTDHRNSCKRGEPGAANTECPDPVRETQPRDLTKGGLCARARARWSLELTR
jgi:hypothetical protein